LDVLKQLSRNRLGAIGVAAAVFALLLSFMLTAGAYAQETGAMSIAIDGSGVDCDGDECIVDNGSDFTLTIDVDTAPGAGYIGIQTQIRHNELEYSPTAEEEDEVLVSDDGFPGILVRSTETDIPNSVAHGMTAGTPPAFTASDYTGPILVLAFTCTDDYSRNDLELTPYNEVDNTLGSGFKVSADTPVVPTSDSLLVHCGDPPTPTPAPTTTAGDSPTATLAAGGVPGTGNAGGDGDTRTGLWIAIGSLLAAGAAAGAGALAWKRTRG
jgi:hypothetical protein